MVADVHEPLLEAGPGQPELEFHHDSGDDAQCVIDHIQPSPELRHPQQFGLAADGRARLHHRHQRDQPQREQHEQEVERGRRRELESRDRECVHAAGLYT